MPDRVKANRLRELARVAEQDARDLYFLTRHEPDNLERLNRKARHIIGACQAMIDELKPLLPSQEEAGAAFVSALEKAQGLGGESHG